MSPTTANVATPMAASPVATTSPGNASAAQSDDPGAFGRELQRATERPAARASSTEGETAEPSRRAAGKAGARATPGRERAGRDEAADPSTAATPLAPDLLRADTGTPDLPAADLDTPAAGDGHADDEAGATDLASWMASLLGMPVAPSSAGNLALPVAGGPRTSRNTAGGTEAVQAPDAAAGAADANRSVLDTLRTASPSHAAKGLPDMPAAQPGEGPAAGIGRAPRDAPDPAARALERPAGDAIAQAVTNASASPVNGAMPWPGTAPMGTTPGSAAAPTVVETTLPAALHSAEFAPALGTQIAHFARDGVEHARLQLHPADMGPIAVQLAMDGQQVRVDLVAELAATRQTLEQSLPALAGALRDAGFTLTGGGVFQQARDGGNPGDGRNAPATAGTPGGTRDTPAAGSAPVRPVRTQGLVDLFA